MKENRNNEHSLLSSPHMSAYNRVNTHNKNTVRSEKTQVAYTELGTCNYILCSREVTF